MTQTPKRFLFTATALIVLLAACLPQQQQATPDPVEVANQIATSVALTISAAQAQTEAAQPIPTNTTLPTQTDSAASPTPLLPSATPFVILPPTSTLPPITGGGGGVPAPPPALDCTPINNVPRDNTVFHKNDTFDIKWTIKNTGTRVIPARLDVKYFSGPNMAPGQSPYEIPVDIRPGETHVFDLDGEAPDQLGFHVMTWVVEGNLCYPYVAIIVE